MDVERRQTPLDLRVHGIDAKMAAAAVETRKIPGREARPLCALHAAREHGVENQARAAESAKPRSALPGGRLPLCSHSRHPVEIEAVAAEALRAEIIRRALCPQGRELLFEGIARPGDLAQPDAEAIAAQRAAAQLAHIELRFEHTELVLVHRAPEFRRTARPRAG